VLTPQNEKSVEFEREWSASNPFMWNYDADVQLPLTDAESSDLLQKQNTHFPRDKVQVWNELLSVHSSSESLVPQYKEFLQNDADQFSVRLMTTFFTDLLGKDSLQTRLERRVADEEEAYRVAQAEAEAEALRLAQETEDQEAYRIAQEAAEEEERRLAEEKENYRVAQAEAEAEAEAEALRLAEEAGVVC